MIWLVVNGSGIMSVDERTDVDYKGTDQVTDLERGGRVELIHSS